MPACLAARTTIATLSGPPMLPGLMRTAATPPSIAFRASEALKWMSAITGIGEKRTTRESAPASSVFGTATRTTSQPAEASAAICAVVASTSCVFVSVIDWTTTGAPPPILTPPTEICRWLGMRVSLALAPALQAASADAESAEDVARVVVQRDEEHDQDQEHPRNGDALVDLPCDRTPPERLDQ